MDWNDETIARLRHLWLEGHSTAEIGRRMGVTKNAVVGKAHRLVLVPRPSPIRRGTETGAVSGAETRAGTRPISVNGSRRGRAAIPRVVGPTLPAMAALAVVVAAPVVAAPVALVPRPVVVRAAVRPPVLRAVPSPRAGARVSTCCWPIGDPGMPSFRFCDAGAAANKPYCLAHASLAYVKVRDRREDAA